MTESLRKSSVAMLGNTEELNVLAVTLADMVVRSAMSTQGLYNSAQ